MSMRLMRLGYNLKEKAFFTDNYIFFGTGSIAQTVYINEANYLKKRVSQRLIEDGRIHKMNFANCNMKKMAMLYWPETTV